MIVIKGLDIGYKNKLVHASIDLELQAGKSYALIGENGVGKSTLLKSITGVKSFNRGEISLQNQNLQSLSLNQLSKLVSVVFTTRPNLGDFTVGEVVKMEEFLTLVCLENIHRKIEKLLLVQWNLLV